MRELRFALTGDAKPVRTKMSSVGAKMNIKLTVPTLEEKMVISDKHGEWVYLSKLKAGDIVNVKIYENEDRTFKAYENGKLTTITEAITDPRAFIEDTIAKGDTSASIDFFLNAFGSLVDDAFGSNASVDVRREVVQEQVEEPVAAEIAEEPVEAVETEQEVAS